MKLQKRKQVFTTMPTYSRGAEQATYTCECCDHSGPGLNFNREFGLCLACARELRLPDFAEWTRPELIRLGAAHLLPLSTPDSRNSP